MTKLLERALFLERLVEERLDGGGAAVGVVQQIEIAPYGDDRNSEPFTEIIYGDGAVFLQAGEDEMEALLLSSLYNLGCVLRFGNFLTLSALYRGSAFPSRAGSLPMSCPWSRGPFSI